MQIKDDTIYKRFKAYFRKNFSNSFNGPFGDMFYQDSLFKYDFFNDDYFLKRFEMNNHELSRMYSDMDSIKAEFLKKNYPNGRQKKNK